VPARLMSSPALVLYACEYCYTFHMNFLNAVLIIIGLAIFEIVSSIDNAVINAEILDTMSPKGRKWFMLWGFLFAVFVVRGLLPWVIVWFANPSLGFL